MRADMDRLDEELPHSAGWLGCGRVLRSREKQGNKTRSSVRVEHVFGAQSNDNMGGTLLRGVGLARAKARIGLKNLAYNMRRLVQLDRLAAAV